MIAYDGVPISTLILKERRKSRLRRPGSLNGSTALSFRVHLVLLHTDRAPFRKPDTQCPVSIPQAPRESGPWSGLDTDGEVGLAEGREWRGVDGELRGGTLCTILKDFICAMHIGNDPVQMPTVRTSRANQEPAGKPAETLTSSQKC